ncbi:MAG TPA: DUF2470 domain-containing protein, partial [Solirubrobacteraceae bacterium]|nr:DUF2470 domain-containing protein [Solirubrobacteraceae bacterium]
PDRVAAGAGPAVEHLNRDHADALLAIARALGGYPDATAAECSSIDRLGIDLDVRTARGRAAARVAFPAALGDSTELRAATVELTRRARSAAAAAAAR